MERTYVAVVEGEVEKEKGTIRSFLMENKAFVMYSSNKPGEGDEAITHYKLLKRNPQYSLLEVELETGRKNQIRVHMQDLHHPVLGDIKYGDGNNPLGRLALHAFKLSFYHPVTGDLLEFETPYPSSFKKLFIKQAPVQKEENSKE